MISCTQLIRAQGNDFEC